MLGFDGVLRDPDNCLFFLVAGDDGHRHEQAYHRKSSEFRALNHFKRITGAKVDAAERAAKNAEGGI
jgi:hypothetical protein